MDNNPIAYNETGEMSLKDISTRLGQMLIYLKKQWWKIIMVALLGALLGYFYAYLQPKTYRAKLSFIVEDSKNSSSGLASLAGQFGLDINSNSGNGLLNADNILLFLKSESLIKTTLLTVYDSTKDYSLADKYADVYGLRESWAKSGRLKDPIFFPVHTAKSISRVQDSLLQIMVDRIRNKELIVVRPEKKATFIDVTTTMKDEFLCKWFCERLVREATSRYVISKTQRQKANVDRLEKRADSLGQLLNAKTYSVAVENEKLVDINPVLRTQAVRSEVTSRDKLILGTIFGEVIKNLELAKVQLTQETPTIQIVDTIDLPLKINKSSKIKTAVILFVAFSLIFSLFLLIRYEIKRKIV